MAEPGPSLSDPSGSVTQEDRKDAHEHIQYLLGETSTGRRAKMRHEYIYEPTKTHITSWKVDDWDYKKGRALTSARGLFTRLAEDGMHEIVIRGYDKFFNIDEVSKTKWENIIENTVPPYELTVKENGCIIFIGGLPGGQILVTSKHSLGHRGDMTVSHAEKGHEWLDRHLQKAHKKKEDLARYLFENKLTAVAELCDDTFEEHVLPYTGDDSGLHLHGVNYNTKGLRTWSSEKVAEFAKEWGFIKGQCYIKQSAEEVKEFTDEVRRHCVLDNRPIEGFVVRTKLKNRGKDFFFKVKYDDPYLMYREWREITKKLLNPKNKKRPKPTFELSREYMVWVENKIKTEPDLFREYQKNKGIFRVRDLFLESHNLQSSPELSAKATEQGKRRFDKTLIMPVGTVGCGKTSLCLGLAHLFGFGHVQNDNITGKETRSKFHKAILTEFETKEVVIADRNNHVIKLRETLINAVRARYPNVHIIAITWKYPSKDEVFQITVERVRNRGKNHQSLTTDDVGYEKIIKSFLNSFQPINTDKRPDNLVEDVIEVEITSDIKTSLLTVIDKLKPLLDVKKPGDDELENVLEAVTSYKPSIKKAIKKAKPFYYAIPIRDDLEGVIREYFSTHPNADSKLFNDLVKSDRIFKSFHVTLCHKEDVRANQSLRTQWNRLNNLVNTEVQITLDKLVFDSEVMALTVKDISPESIPWVNKYPHITVGTISPEVKPFKALKLLEKAFDMRPDGVTVIDLQDRHLTLEGHVQGVYNV